MFQDPTGKRLNSWTARSSSGLKLMGTWTAVPDRASGAVTGTWTLIDAQGNMVAHGDWAAAKAPSGWTGAWRASVARSTAEHSGTWSSGTALKANAPFTSLFEKAVQAVVSGKWRYGGHSGSWSIRAYK